MRTRFCRYVRMLPLVPNILKLRRHIILLFTKPKELASYWHTHYWPENYFASGYFKESCLIIRLEGDAEKEFGMAIPALELSQRVLEFWENQLNPKI
jgi:hypothetical protein